MKRLYFGDLNFNIFKLFIQIIINLFLSLLKLILFFFFFLKKKKRNFLEPL
jgi:hypothetical protein